MCYPLLSHLGPRGHCLNPAWPEVRAVGVLPGVTLGKSCDRSGLGFFIWEDPVISWGYGEEKMTTEPKYLGDALDGQGNPVTPRTAGIPTPAPASGQPSLSVRVRVRRSSHHSPTSLLPRRTLLRAGSGA